MPSVLHCYFFTKTQRQQSKAGNPMAGTEATEVEFEEVEEK
ncbi:MAG: hypothetical protein AB8H47_26285 [Bacteroidia bacterium]